METNDKVTRFHQFVQLSSPSAKSITLVRCITLEYLLFSLTRVRTSLSFHPNL